MEEKPPAPEAPKYDETPKVRRHKMFSGRDLRASTIGWEIAIPLFAGPVIGFVIDRRFDTGVRWTMILMLTGVLLAVIAVIRYLSYEMYLMNKELEKKDQDARRNR